MVWSNRNQNDQNNTKGFTPAGKKEIEQLQRKVNSKQKFVDSKNKTKGGKNR